MSKVILFLLLAISWVSGVAARESDIFTSAKPTGSKPVDAELEAGGGVKRIAVVDGKTYVAYISAYDMNRIVTPFDKPAIDTQSDATITTTGREIMVTPRSSAPVAMYIRDASLAGETYQLVLKPAQLPVGAQIELVGSGKNVVGKTDRLDSSKSEWLEAVRSLVQGSQPRGYGLVNESEGESIRVGQVSVVREKVYQSGQNVLSVYRVRNESGVSVELLEQSFYREGVRFISFFPDLVLEPGGETSLHIIARKE